MTDLVQEVLMDRTFHVYMLAGESGVLYTGITNNLMRRVWVEAHGRAAGAIAREKQIKAWRRAKKVALIAVMNPQWKDLSAEIQ
jgi:putative endonuclease